MFKTIGKHVPPPAGVRSPALWGTQAHLGALFPGHQIAGTKQMFTFRYKSASHRPDVFKTYYGPMNRAFAALDLPAQFALEVDLRAVMGEMNRGGETTLLIPSEYLQAVITVP